MGESELVNGDKRFWILLDVHVCISMCIIYVCISIGIS